MAVRNHWITAVLVGVCLAGCTSNPENVAEDDRQPAPLSPQPTYEQPNADAAAGAAATAQDASGATGGSAEHRSRMEEIVVTAAKLGSWESARVQPSVQGANYRVIQQSEANRDQYDHFAQNGIHLVAEAPVSTFSIDVDTASYANVRRYLNGGQLPPSDAIRIEEMINYFSYDYPIPDHASDPFSVSTEVGPSPWNEGRKLLRIGIRGFERTPAELPAANLVFLVDTSGSMQSRDKLELVKASLRMLARQLRAEDRISMVAYAGAAGVVLDPTAGDETATILGAIDQLQAGGSTNGGAGIVLAYRMAESAMIESGVNRVILATDGDFNVGLTSQKALKQMVEEKKKSGVSLTVLGFGRGNLNDALMQEISQIGDGNAAYIDTLQEARKVLVDEMSSTFETIANDVKIQVEFNPSVVAEYRLIGYESRHLEREDFNNDRVDAGDIGAGHRVTALYELTLVDSDAHAMDPLRYQSSTESNRGSKSGEIAFVKLRYKTPGSATSKLTSVTVSADDSIRDLARTSEDFRFGTAVAAFGQLLKGGKYANTFEYADVAALAQGARGADEDGYRAEFINLVRSAAALAGEQISKR